MSVFTINKAILRKMNERDTALWNSGDLVSFCNGYAEDAVFVNGGMVICGREAILAHYRATYGEDGQQGALLLTTHDCGPSESAQRNGIVGWALIQWSLRQDNRLSQGLSALTFKSVDGALLIANDLSWAT